MKTSHPTRKPPVTALGAPLLEVQELAVAYGGIKALKGVSLTVHCGEIVAMIGAIVSPTLYPAAAIRRSAASRSPTRAVPPSNRAKAGGLIDARIRTRPP